MPRRWPRPHQKLCLTRQSCCEVAAKESSRPQCRVLRQGEMAQPCQQLRCAAAGRPPRSKVCHCSCEPTTRWWSTCSTKLRPICRSDRHPQLTPSLPLHHPWLAGQERMKLRDYQLLLLRLMVSERPEGDEEGRWREPCTRCPLKRAQRWWEKGKKQYTVVRVSR